MCSLLLSLSPYQASDPALKYDPARPASGRQEAYVVGLCQRLQVDPDHILARAVACPRAQVRNTNEYFLARGTRAPDYVNWTSLCMFDMSRLIRIVRRFARQPDGVERMHAHFEEDS